MSSQSMAPDAEPPNAVFVCLRDVIHRQFFSPLVDEGGANDTFEELSLKTMLAASLPFAVIVSPAFGAYFLFVYLASPETPGVTGTFFPGAVSAVWAANIIVSYLVVKRTKAYPVVLRELSLLLISLMCLGAAMQAPYTMGLQIPGLVPVIIGSAFPFRIRAVAFAIGVAGFLLQAHNLTAALYADAAPWSAAGRPYYGTESYVRGGTWRTRLELMVCIVGNGWATALALAGVAFAMVAHHNALHARVAAAARLSAFAGARLQRYDTAAVLSAVVEYRGIAAFDERVAEAFALLCRNLDVFRPYLPTWVLASAADGPADGRTASSPSAEAPPGPGFDDGRSDDSAAVAAPAPPSAGSATSSS